MPTEPKEILEFILRKSIEIITQVWPYNKVNIEVHVRMVKGRYVVVLMDGIHDEPHVIDIFDEVFFTESNDLDILYNKTLRKLSDSMESFLGDHV